MNKLSEIRQREIEFGPVAQLGERTVRIREVRGFDPLRVHQTAHIRTLTQAFICLTAWSLSRYISLWENKK